MTEPTDNVFPVFDSDGAASTAQSGLTKVEYFAALAMQGILAAEVALDPNHQRSETSVAAMAVSQAYALIAELHETSSY